MTEPRIARENFFRSLADSFVFCISCVRGDYSRVVVGDQLGVPRSKIRVINIAVRQFLLQTVGHGDIRHATVNSNVRRYAVGSYIRGGGYPRLLKQTDVG